MDLRCSYCESRLPPGAAKCPYCGAPAPTGTSAPSRAGRLTFGTFLLAALFVLGVFQSAVLIAQPITNQQSGIGFGLGDFPVHGRVTNATGAPVPNVTVAALGPKNLSAVTDAAGNFSILHLNAGYYELEARNATATARVRVFVTSELRLTVQLPERGDAPPLDDPSAERLVAMTRACGGIFLVFSLLPLAGAVACHRRRNWGLALAGAITGTFVALPISLLVGILGILVISMGRRDFNR